MDRFLSMAAVGLSFLLLYLTLFVIQAQFRIIAVAVLTAVNSALVARIVHLHRLFETRR